MCGIAGFTGLGGREDILRMTGALFHRGPDEGGIFQDGPVALGHRRLSILDISGGQQPMADSESGTVIVYNGEIYNHPELRERLESLGHVFGTSHSDTETLLRAFLQWGPECFAMLNGMFACAIYSPRQKKLWLARDRFGEKPLFCARMGNFFAFASEPCALMLWPGFDGGFDAANVQRFFAWNYMPAGRSVYKNCWSLQPGHWLSLELDGGRAAEHCYWRFELQPDESLNGRPEGELVEELRHLLVEATRRRLLSDVPAGVFLSGGLDSSAILAAACRSRAPEELQTFTIGFRERSFDESDKARLVASCLGARHHVDMLTEERMQAGISDILEKMSEPFGDASLIPTRQLTGFARKKVTVALSGDGGDELFAGYDPLQALAPASLYRALVPGPLHRAMRALAGFLPASDRNMSLDFKIRRMLRGLSQPASIQLPVWMSGLEPDEIGEFFEKPLSAVELYEDAISLREKYPRLDELGHALMFFTRFYLTDDILVKVDRASMQVSLESRAVFLDNDLVAFCQRLPNRFKYRGGVRKYLLRKALTGWLPEKIVDLPKKGFGIPLNRWLRHLPAPGGNIPGLKPGVIGRCEKAHRARKGDFRFFLWDLQSFSRMQTPAAR